MELKRYCNKGNYYISPDRIDNDIEARSVELDRIITDARFQLNNMPSGRIVTGLSNGIPRFFYVDEEKMSKREYIKKGDTLIKCLAQKRYLEKVIELAEKEKKRIKLLKKGEARRPEEAIYTIPEALRVFVVPVCQCDNDYIQNWEANSFDSLDEYDAYKKYETDRGELVRSKSEWIVANLLYKNGIPYKYEKKLVLSDGDFLFPDFTVLNLQTRQEVYIELFGMMGEAKYCSDAIRKINKYAANGIVVGERLLPIFESAEVPLEIRTVRMTLDRLTMREAA